MALTRSAFSDLVTAGFDKYYFDAQATGSPSDAIFNTAGSSKQSEKASGLITGGHLATKAEGVGKTPLNAYLGYDTELTHSTLAGYLELTEELIEDDLSGTIRRLPSGLATIAVNTKEQQRINFLLTGFTTANGGDSKTLWSTTHPKKSGGTWQNRPSTELDISPANYRAARAAFFKMPDHYGVAREQVAAVALVAPEENDYWNEIIKSAYVADSGNRNESNWQNSVQVVQSARWGISDTDQWALFADKSSHGIIMYERIAPQVRALDNSDSDFATGNMRMQVRARWSVGDELSGIGTWGTTGI